jgi:hypothetical protein
VKPYLTGLKRRDEDFRSAIGLPSFRAQTDGNFLSTADDIAVNLNKHLSLNADTNWDQGST